MISYSTAQKKINSFIKDFRIKTPKGKYSSNRGYSFKYAPGDRFEEIRDYVESLGIDFAGVYLDEEYGITIIRMCQGWNP